MKILLMIISHLSEVKFCDLKFMEYCDISVMWTSVWLKLFSLFLQLYMFGYIKRNKFIFLFEKMRKVRWKFLVLHFKSEWMTNGATSP